MPASVAILDTVTSLQQLKSLPVGDSISLLMSSDLDTESAYKNISLVRVDSSQDLPNFSDLVYKIQNESEYGVVSIDIDASEAPNGFIVSISPHEPLVPSSNYLLVIDKDLAPISTTVSKTISVGPSKIEAFSYSETPGEEADYRVVVSSQSTLTSSSHNVSIEIYSGVDLLGTHDLNLKEVNTVDLNDSHYISLNPSLPFMLNEEFSVTTQSIQRLGETKVLKISTYIASDVVESPENTSSRLQQQDILSFYENSHWAESVATVDEATASVSGTVASFTFVFPNTVIIDLGTEVQSVSVTDSLFNVEIGYAFGNYMLPRMGLHDDNKKYVVEYSPITSPLTSKIKIKIVEDVNSIVGDSDKFVYQRVV